MRGRGDRLAASLAERELPLILVTDLTNVRYLTGFTGTNGACICGPDTRLFLTDFRYTERAAAEVEGWEAVTVADDWLGGIAARLSGRFGFEDEHVSVRLLERLRGKLAEGIEPVAAGGAVEELRRVKDEGELEAIAAASELADEVWRWSLERGLAGRSERDVARAAEARIRELGGDPSFPAIVAAGPNGALPHAEPGEGEIGAGELVVFDMGAKLDGYCSDGTRTFAVGEPGERAREVYEVVRGAQAAALEAVAGGIGGEDLEVLGPFIPLASLLGRVAVALAPGRPQRIVVAAHGPLSEYDTRLLTAAALNGVFQDSVDQVVNVVNAPFIAAERGIAVVEERYRASRDYTNSLEVTIAADGDEAMVSGTTIGPEPRLFLGGALGFGIDLEIGPHMVFIRYDDQPGVIGRVGSMFGGAGVNIANMAVSRTKEGGEALMVFSIDTPATAELVDALHDVGFDDVRFVELG